MPPEKPVLTTVWLPKDKATDGATHQEIVSKLCRLYPVKHKG